MELAQSSTTSTTEVPRIVGDPPAEWVPWTAGAALLAAIVLGGLVVSRRTKRTGSG